MPSLRGVPRDGDPERGFAPVRRAQEERRKILGEAGDCMTKERILRKFSRPRRERPTPRSETSLVTKTGHPLGSPLGMPLGIRFVGIMWGGGR